MKTDERRQWAISTKRTEQEQTMKIFAANGIEHDHIEETNTPDLVDIVFTSTQKQADSIFSDMALADMFTCLCTYTQEQEQEQEGQLTLF